MRVTFRRSQGRPKCWPVHLGCVKLFSKKVWFSDLLQQTVMWCLSEWSALWSR